jgi:FdhD protein
MSAAVVAHGVLRVDGSRSSCADEWLAVEEPLEIQVAGEPVATTMRTPGEDHFLALGFLFAEGIIAGADDVCGVYPAGPHTASGFRSVVDVVPSSGARIDVARLERSHRAVTPSSACGVCGRDSIADLCARLVPRALRKGGLDGGLLARAPQILAEHQPRFLQTGGMHAACAVNGRGEVLAHAEDVGRHNAVDKVVGRLLCRKPWPLDGEELLLVVSGRASFEVVQKAAVAGFGTVASVSAPSSLAVATAHQAGVTLAGFVREGRFSLYTHPERIAMVGETPMGAPGEG